MSLAVWCGCLGAGYGHSKWGFLAAVVARLGPLLENAWARHRQACFQREPPCAFTRPTLARHQTGLSLVSRSERAEHLVRDPNGLGYRLVIQTAVSAPPQAKCMDRHWPSCPPSAEKRMDPSLAGLLSLGVLVRTPLGAPEPPKPFGLGLPLPTRHGPVGLRPHLRIHSP